MSELNIREIDRQLKEMTILQECWPETVEAARKALAQLTAPLGGKFAEIEARLAAATPGPHQTRFVYRLIHAVRQHGLKLGLMMGPDTEKDWADADLWANAHTDILALLQEIRRLFAAPKYWRCFHCNFETSDQAAALAHFGDRDESTALCVDWMAMTDADKANEYQGCLQELNGARAEIETLTAAHEADRQHQINSDARIESQRAEIKRLIDLEVATQERNYLISRLNMNYLDQVQTITERLSLSEATREQQDAEIAGLRDALGRIRPFLAHREDNAEVCYDWCPMCRADAALAAVPPAPAHPEICICAAIRMPDGEVIRGHRHNHCYDVVRVRVGAIHRREDIVHTEQGFVTSLNRFVGREEAMRLQREAGIPSAFSQDGVLRGDLLFSEDLYGEPPALASEEKGKP